MSLPGPAAAEILRRAYGTSTNRMTPVVISTSLIGEGVAVEVSTSDPQPDLGDTRPTLFGVSVAVLRSDGMAFKVGSDKGSPIRSTVFGSRAAADAHVEAMREHLARTALTPKGDNS